MRRIEARRKNGHYLLVKSTLSMMFRAFASSNTGEIIVVGLYSLTGCEFQAPQKCLRLISVYAINFML
jgi:hypothetical protein